MKIDLTQVFVNIVTGQPFNSSYPGDQEQQVDKDGELKVDDKGEPVMGPKMLRLGEVLADAYLAPDVDPNTGRDQLQGKEKLERTNMARKILANSQGTVSLKVEQIAKAKELVNKISQLPMVIGLAWEMLDEAEKETEDTEAKADA